MNDDASYEIQYYNSINGHDSPQFYNATCYIGKVPPNMRFCRRSQVVLAG